MAGEDGVKLLEYKRFQEVPEEFFKPNIVALSDEEMEAIESKEAFYKSIGLKWIYNKRLLWMKKHCKFHRRNGKFQGMTGVDWNRIEMIKRR